MMDAHREGTDTDRRILIVDDEERYRTELLVVLAPLCARARTAASGREAIDIGVRFQPHLLVVDWLLKDRLHGLHVAQALRATNPDLQTILITGFATVDLRQEARRLHIFSFVEKPFDVDHIEARAREAFATPAESADALHVGILDVAADGTLRHMNARAGELLSMAVPSGTSLCLADVVGRTNAAALDDAIGQWMDIPLPSKAQRSACAVRARQWPDSADRLLLVIGKEERHLRHHPTILTLLDVEPPGGGAWPFDGHVLIVDDLELVRRTLLDGLQYAGAICHAAGTVEQALRLLEGDAAIQFVLLDHDRPGVKPARLVDEMRAIKPQVTIIGCSGQLREEDFARLGVRLYLAKPFTAGDLVRCLTGAGVAK